MDATFQNYVYDLINKAVKRTLTVIRYIDILPGLNAGDS